LRQGLEQGIRQGKLDVAKNLKEKGLSNQDIVDVTNLSIEDIEVL
jgi:predicted transposase/invertase (TIGR01784 family)